MEKYINPEVNIEVNLEENESMCLFSRLEHPTVKSQILDLMWRHEIYLSEKEPNHKLISKEKLENEYNSSLLKIKDRTNINFTSKQPNPDEMSLDFRIFGKRLSVKQMSMIEAHEKGHCIRHYTEDDFYNEYFWQGFDFRKLKIDEYYENLLKDVSDKAILKKSDINDFFRYFRQPRELVERMSQLKNYFGFKGDEIFTKNHLEYAKLHYVNDMGIVDNMMKLFFSCITPEKEEKFLELINNSGV